MKITINQKDYNETTEDMDDKEIDKLLYSYIRKDAVDENFYDELLDLGKHLNQFGLQLDIIVEKVGEEFDGKFDIIYYKIIKL